MLSKYNLFVFGDIFRSSENIVDSIHDQVHFIFTKFGLKYWNLAAIPQVMESNPIHENRFAPSHIDHGTYHCQPHSDAMLGSTTLSASKGRPSRKIKASMVCSILLALDSLLPRAIALHWKEKEINNNLSPQFYCSINALFKAKNTPIYSKILWMKFWSPKLSLLRAKLRIEKGNVFTTPHPIEMLVFSTNISHTCFNSTISK